MVFLQWRTFKVIVYIVSDVRSGSTLLENILAKSDDIISVGELHHLDSHIHKGVWGKTWNWNCSCGVSVKNCIFWSRIFETMKLESPFDIKHTQLSLSDSHKDKKIISQLDSIYDAIKLTSSNQIIVDSSKKPNQAVALYTKSKHDFKIIYLTRDVRAVAISKSKWSKKFNVKGSSLYKSLFATFKYRLLCERLLCCISKEDIYQLNYESLLDNSSDVLNQVSKFLNVSNITMPRYMELENDHTIGGTPNRFEKREIKIDNGWISISNNKPLFNCLGFIFNKITNSKKNKT
jgi:hypothetical protein